MSYQLRLNGSRCDRFVKQQNEEIAFLDISVVRERRNPLLNTKESDSDYHRISLPHAIRVRFRGGDRPIHGEQRGETRRCAGNGHAWTPRFCSPNISISPCLIGLTSVGSSGQLRARHPLIYFAVTTNSLLHDVGATVAVLGGAYTLVLIFESLTKQNVIPQVSLIR
ncbi:unnamed protein product [Microthlaspi erraticum]|uniref:Uncharacterized protein n=1 Tax=Microthlaspi erraticum TaxID=1685480 RepID=A0A6D2HH33_9BRAS|nr:unnamed protein product [Microthlaspi erraticum]